MSCKGFFLLCHEFHNFLLREFISPVTYVNAVIVGVSINILSGYGFPGAIVPYIVPVFVQVVSKASVKFRNRSRDALLQLPAKRVDPAFIMDLNGNILFSTGKTAQTFEKFNISNLQNFIGSKNFTKLISIVNEQEVKVKYSELFSELTGVYYSVRVRPVKSGSGQYLVWFNDISRRREMEDKLKEQAAFVEMNPAPVLNIRPDGTVINFNPAAKEIFKININNPPIDTLLPGVKRISLDSIENSGRLQLETEIGEYKYLFTFKNDSLSGSIYIYGSDITKLKQIEKDLAQMALFAELNPFPVLRLNKYGKILLANKAAKIYFDDSVLTGKLWFDLIPDCGITGTDKIIELDRAVQQEAQIRNKTLLITYLGNPENNNVHVYCTDITEQKLTMEEKNRLKAAIDQVYDAVIITDIYGKIEYVNPSFEVLTGFTSEEAAGSNTSILKSGEHSSDFYKDMWKTILKGDIWNGELINKRISGERYYEEMTITPIKNSQNEIKNFVAIKRDVSVKKQLEEKLDRLRREHKAFLRHELKNLLTPIKGNADLLAMTAKNVLSEKQMNNFDRISQYTVRIIDLIDNLKELQDFEIDQHEINKTEYDLSVVVEQAVTDINILADKYNVQIEYKNSSEKSGIKMDRSLLPGVFINLIKNAVEHVREQENPEGKIVRVSIYNENGNINVKINNKGEPVTEDKLKVFFEKFNSDRLRKKDGTGLGTTYAYLVTKAHDGSISVESDKKEGTTVKVAFELI